MRIFAYLTAALLLELLLQPSLSANTPSVDTTPVSESVTVFRVNSKVGNTNSVLVKRGDKSLLIDPNFYQTTSLLKDELRMLGVIAPNFLSVSHIHRDHTEQLPDFHNVNNLLIVSTSQAKILREDKLINDLGRIKEIEGAYQIKLNDLAVEVAVLPAVSAHTLGDLIYYIAEDQTLVVGDYLFTHGYPIIDKKIGNINGYFKNLQYILETYSNATRIVAGHSAISPAPQAIFNYREFSERSNLLKQSVCLIKTRQAEGLSKEQIKSRGLGATFSEINQGAVFIKESRWIDFVFEQKVTFCEKKHN